MRQLNGGYFTKFKGRDAQFYFNLKAPNHKIILKSEGYTSASGRDNGIQSVKENSPYDKNYERLNATNGQYYFNLLAANGKIIGTSETYTTTYSRNAGIEDVKRYAPTASIQEGRRV